MACSCIAFHQLRVLAAARTCLSGPLLAIVSVVSPVTPLAVSIVKTLIAAFVPFPAPVLYIECVLESVPAVFKGSRGVGGMTAYRGWSPGDRLAYQRHAISC
jgi:hypothetical protein